MNNEFEIFSLIALRHSSSLVYQSFPVSNLWIEFVFWVLPTFVCISSPILLFKTHVTLLIIALCLKVIFGTFRNPESSIYTPIKAHIMLMVTISIFACDFNFFPRKFLKTVTYGVSLMDVGIGSFLYHNGAFSVKMTTKRILKSVSLLFSLGVTRLLVVRYFNYEVELTEYGRDMNFYFVLGLVYLCFLILDSKHNFVVAFIFLVIHQICLSLFLTDYIFDFPRCDFFSANKEGFLSVVPSLSIFMFANVLGRQTFKSNCYYLKTWILRFSVFFFLAYLVTSQFTPMSRRLCNAPYVFWIVFVHSVHILLTMIFKPIPSFLEEFVAGNMMVVFLISNLLVLYANLKYDCKMFSFKEGLKMNGMYLGIVFILVPMVYKLFRKEKKVK